MAEQQQQQEGQDGAGGDLHLQTSELQASGSQASEPQALEPQVALARETSGRPAWVDTASPQQDASSREDPQLSGSAPSSKRRRMSDTLPGMCEGVPGMRVEGDGDAPTVGMPDSQHSSGGSQLTSQRHDPDEVSSCRRSISQLQLSRASMCWFCW